MRFPMQTSASSAPPNKNEADAIPTDRSLVPRNRLIVFSTIAIAGGVLDLSTKSWMFAHLGMPGGNVWWLWEGVFGFQTSLNQGALFGLGQGFAMVFAALSILAALGILYWLFVAGAAQDWLLTISLAMISAGILGNLFDRLGLHGLKSPAGEALYAVRDFVLVMIGKHAWPNFNIADSFLVCGAGLLVLHSILTRSPATDADTEPVA